MKQSLIVGVDVSKRTLDFYFKPTEQHLQIDNMLSGYRRFTKFLSNQVTDTTDVLIVMEHTGYYSYQFEKYLQSKSLSYCKLPALEIKRSIGMVRGKDDKVDAERIAMYGWLRRDLLQADHYPIKAIQKLRALVNTRQKLVRDKVGYQNRLKELSGSGLFEKSDPLISIQRRMINQLAKEIKAVETLMLQLIKAEDAMHKTYKLLITIKGVALVIASAMIAYTDNFKRFTQSRKFNCYAGLAPFKHKSGDSIEKRSRVSHLANKMIKALLGMAASSAVQHDPELKQYYNRRLQNGKQVGQCLNIIKAKLVARMFAVVNRNTPYQILKSAA